MNENDKNNLQKSMNKFLNGNYWVDYSDQITYSIKNKKTGQIIAFYPDGRIYGQTCFTK